MLNFSAMLVHNAPSRIFLCRDELVTFLKDFREQRNNTLSGLTVEDIIVKISEIIRGRKPHSEKVFYLFRFSYSFFIVFIYLSSFHPSMFLNRYFDAAIII